MKKIILIGFFIVCLTTIGSYIGISMVDREVRRVKQENEALIKEKHALTVEYSKVYSERTRLWREIDRLKARM